LTTALDQRIILHTISHDKLIVLEDRTPVRSAAQHSHGGEQLAEQVKRFGLNPIREGAGLECEEYTQIEQSYQEALIVLRLKELYPVELAHCRHYGELGYFRALPMLHNERREARYVNESLERLEHYDRKH